MAADLALRPAAARGPLEPVFVAVYHVAPVREHPRVGLVVVRLRVDDNVVEVEDDGLRAVEETFEGFDAAQGAPPARAPFQDLPRTSVVSLTGTR